MEQPIKILIVGAGFGGMRAALDLHATHLPNTKITLVNPYLHFEYHASLYKALTGRSPMSVCIPIQDIFEDTDVEVVEDRIEDIDIAKKQAKGASDSIYQYDYLVLAVGSQPAYYDIPGLAELSFSIKSIADAIRLKRHLHESFLECSLDSSSNKSCNTHIAIVGGGATGVEIAGELVDYTRKLAKKHGVDQSMVKIDLVSSSDRLVPDLSERISSQVKQTLERMGVTVYLGKRVMKEEVQEVYLKAIKLKAKTVIWAAGVKGHELYERVGLPVDKKGKVLVDEYLQPKSTDSSVACEDVFILGDGAATKYSGMAHTALHNGAFVAANIACRIKSKSPERYMPQPVRYYLPVGPRWAATDALGFETSGYLGWTLKRLHDLTFFTSILPFSKAVTAFAEDKILWESCPICTQGVDKA